LVSYEARLPNSDSKNFSVTTLVRNLRLTTRSCG
jgi:hypothetical protein